MRIEKTVMIVKLWLSAEDTCYWATRPGNSWPCSQLAGKRLFVEFDNSDLINFTVNGKSDFDLPCDEFMAITDDFIKGQENT